MGEPCAKLRPYTEDCENAVNNHIQRELHAWYAFINMANACAKDSIALHGFKKYFKYAAVEAYADAAAFMKYQIQRGGTVKLPVLNPPEETWTNPSETWTHALELEKSIAEDLYNVVECADKCHDYALQSFVQDNFLQKETRHIKDTADIVRQVKRVQDEGIGLYELDKEFRKYGGMPKISNKATELSVKQSKPDSFINQKQSFKDQMNSHEMRLKDTEMNRMQFRHHLMKYAWGHNYSSPIKENLEGGDLKILDIGCGPGTWILDMANEYPFCKFTALDMSSINSSQIKPGNVTCIQHNILLGLPFKDHSFDFIHMRFWGATLTEKQWNEIMKEVVRVLTPHGWVEFMEFNSLCENAGPFTNLLMNSYRSYLKSKKINGIITPRLVTYLSETGQISEIHQSENLIPIGAWAQAYSKAGFDDFFGEIKSIQSLVSEFMNITMDAFNDLLDHVKEELNIRKYHTSIPCSRIWGQKRFSETESLNMYFYPIRKKIIPTHHSFTCIFFVWSERAYNNHQIAKTNPYGDHAIIHLTMRSISQYEEFDNEQIETTPTLQNTATYGTFDGTIKTLEQCDDDYELESQLGCLNPFTSCTSSLGIVKFPTTLYIENSASTARDQFSLERNFLAWLRISTSFNLIGLAIYFRFNLVAPEPTKISTIENEYAKPIGLIFVTCGILTLLWALTQYFSFQKQFATGVGKVENNAWNFFIAFVIGFFIFVALFVNILFEETTPRRRLDDNITLAIDDLNVLF
ncbi:hypothetical protein G9A89_009184 [Geosiphon pyriformis]|nr:hypothetical protein G9A89_009184 [Geosiphon pyriformis]